MHVEMSEWKEVVMQALGSEESLTEWEYEFVASLADYESHYPLSDRQVEQLEKIKRKLA